MNSLDSLNFIKFFQNSSKLNNHFKNSKSQSNYNGSKTDYQDSSIIFSSIIKSKKKNPNSSLGLSNESYFHTINNETRNIKTQFMRKLCNGTFYPRTLKSKKYLKEIKGILPPLLTTNDFFSQNSEYQETIDNFHTIYQNKGYDLLKNLDKMNEGKIDNLMTYNIFKNNKINNEESKYIKNIFRKNRKENLNIGFKRTEFDSPQNSLMTLKINKSIIRKMTQDISNYQYQAYASIINSHQKDKIKICMVPRPLIKGIKYHLNLNNAENNLFNSAEKNTKKPITINKNLIDKINKKIDIDESPKKKNKKKIKFEENNEEEKPPDIFDSKKIINSTIMRNSLIFQIKNYYCKYIPQSNNCNPNARMEASLTPYFNGLFLYGGLQTQNYSDLWYFNIENKRYAWERKIIKNENIFNSRSCHTTVLYNDCLYIYGGNINLKRLKNQLEDILIYNIRNNTLKSAQFKNEKNRYSQKYIYIPLRRNHIAHVIGWNMIVYGGIDILKEFSKENNMNNTFINTIFKHNDYRQEPKNEIININHHVLGDFMALDLNTLRWMYLSNIFYKTKNHKKLQKLHHGIPRVYHSSCLVLKPEHFRKGAKLNIYKNIDKLDEEINLGIIEKDNMEISYEGIYIFGGMDENLIESNSFFILHCFRNPLFFFEPKMKGTPPSPRCMASMNFNQILNFITIYGGKDSQQIFGDLFILDIMNFQWLQVELFGSKIENGRMGHCSEIINDKLFIFGGCDENNKYVSAKVICIELDLIRNKKLGKIYEFATFSLSQNPKDKTAKNIIELLNIGAELPRDIYPLLKMDN